MQQGRAAILCEEVKTSLSDKAEFEQNLKECGFLGENIAGRGNSKHKGHQAGGALVHYSWKRKKALMVQPQEQGQVVQSSPCRARIITVVTIGTWPSAFYEYAWNGKLLESFEKT